MSFSSAGNRFNAFSGNVKGALTLMVAAGLFATMTMIIKVLGSHLHVTQILFVRQVIMMSIVAPQILKGFPGVLKTTQPGLQPSAPC